MGLARGMIELGLARAIVATHGSRTQAQALATSAHALIVAAGSKSDHRTIDAWMRQHAFLEQGQ